MQTIISLWVRYRRFNLFSIVELRKARFSRSQLFHIFFTAIWSKPRPDGVPMVLESSAPSERFLHHQLAISRGPRPDHRRHGRDGVCTILDAVGDHGAPYRRHDPKRDSDPVEPNTSSCFRKRVSGFGSKGTS